MKALFWKFAFSTAYFAASISIPMASLQAEEVDFSCMSYHVKGKIQVSQKYKEYDIVVHNRCPGTVYWTMCIERMNPWTSEIQVGLTPSGKLEKQKKSRVNLHMKQRSDKSGTRHAFQTFYMNIGYALKPSANVQCFASECESKKLNLRKQVRKNDADWHKEKTALAARISTECHSGWESSATDTCEAEIRQSSQAKMDQFAQTEKELKNRMWAIDPVQCQVHASD